MLPVPGTPAPMFVAPSSVNPAFAFASLGGRYMVLLFLPHPGPDRETALAQLAERRSLMRDDQLLVFGVLPDEESFAEKRGVEDGMRWFLDASGDLRRLYGAIDDENNLAPVAVAIDPSMRVLGTGPLAHVGGLLEKLASFGSADEHAGTPLNAPVLILPRVLEPAFCRRLIDHYETVGGEPSGVMRVRDGRTVGVLSDFKRRRDASIPSGELLTQLRARIVQRLLPEVRKAFQFRATRIERFMVACYDAEEGGYFHPHRDDTTPGTAHRKFAVSINLNAEEYEGGDLRFPEFGRRTYRPPTGGAVVFSCSLLHEATPVTRGRRYATLPFLYDDEGAKIREANLHTIAGETYVEPPRDA